MTDDSNVLVFGNIYDARCDRGICCFGGCMVTSELNVMWSAKLSLSGLRSRQL